ncbi:unnamed protein product [Auanema sp. JU1783]|nr:unnamed protein product [Auanema sp. JU1783]
MERIYVFLSLFSLVYFFEAIGGSYIIAAIQNIEKQFQIPSKFSGFMVSASDMGYIPSVLLISYLGSRGNRAKWIGGGAIMMAVTYLMIASPNFIFPTLQVRLNESDAESTVRVTSDLLDDHVTLQQLLAYPLIKDRIPSHIRFQLLALPDTDGPVAVDEASLESPRHADYSYFSIDSWILDEVCDNAKEIIEQKQPEKAISLLKLFISRRVNNTEADIFRLKRSSAAPFSYCGELVNKIRRGHAALRCQDAGSSSGVFLIMFTALFFLGIGRTMPWSLGVPMLDDNIKKRNLPVYFGAISFIRILGPICGHLIGSFTNKVYYTLNAPPGLTASDPTWIGAWWIGFLIIGTVTLFPSIFLFLFPSGKSKVSTGEEGQKSNDLVFFDKHKEKSKDESLLEKAKGFTKSYKEVMGTKIYLGAAFGRIVDILAFKGYIVFLPKYLENHFGIPLFRVHQFMAAFGVFGFALGTAMGGIITKKYKFNGRQASLFVLFVSSINLALYFSKAFIACDSIVQNVAHHTGNQLNNFTKPCNLDCGCTAAKLYPVCTEDGHAYYSPCHAGCREVRINKNNTHDIEFSSCECTSGGVVRKDYCRDNCKWPIVIFFSTVLSGAFFAGMGLVPGMLILLRSVPPATRSASLGLQGLLVSLFGTLPSPVLWGAIVDSACLVWEQNCQGGNGSCAIFDAPKLRWRMHMMYVVIRGLSLFTDVFVWCHAKDLSLMDEEEEKNEAEKEVTTNEVALRELERSPSLR